MTMTRIMVSLVAGAALACSTQGVLAQSGSDDSTAPRRGVVGWANQQAIVLSPLQIDTRPHDSMYSTPLTVSRQSLDSIRDAESVSMVGFPLSDAQLVDLEMRRIRVFDRNAEFVSGNNPAQSLAELNREGRTQMFGGEVAGVPGSSAFIAFTPTGTNGFVSIDGETHIISSGAHTETALPRIFNMSTMPEGAITWKDFQCSAINPATMQELNETEITPGRLEEAMAQLPIAPPPGQTNFARNDDEPEDDCRVVNVAIETDYQMGQEFLASEDPRQALTDYVETLVGSVSYIYDENVNLQFNVIFLRDWLAEGEDNDPWEGFSTADVLFELREEWTPDSAPTGLVWNGVHLLSTRNLGGGIAFLSGMCNLDIAHAVSADLNLGFPLDPNGLPTSFQAQNYDVFVVAHEWGHNLGAPHTHGKQPPIDLCAFGDCSQAEGGTIMSYCGLCPGGFENVDRNFDTRILNENIRPVLNAGIQCNLVQTNPDICDLPPVADCIADVNGDGRLNGGDFAAWIIAYNAGDLRADINRDGQLRPNDFNAWLAAFQAGCDFPDE